MSAPSPSEARSGFIFGLIAYVFWGIVPLYFAQVKGVEAFEILAHRIGWSLPLMLVVLAFFPGGYKKLGQVLTQPKLLLWLLLSATLLSGNWLLYIYATVTGRIAEASLGYFMMPLVNAFLATVFLGERLRTLQLPALGLIAVGVAIPFVARFEFAWLPVVIPVTFGLYGLVRKKIPVDSSTGLTVETLLLAVPCGGYMIFKNVTRSGVFLVDPTLTGWLLLGGVVTVVPLLTYTLSIRSLPLLTQSFIQFISPTVQLLIAVLVMHETVGWDRWAAMGCVWAAVALFIVDAVLHTRRVRKQREAAAYSAGVPLGAVTTVGS